VSYFDRMRVEKANPYHDGKGKFTTADGAAGGLTEMFGRVQKPDGGFTYSPSHKSEPTEGYALSIYPDRSFAVDAKDLKLKHLVDYAIKNKDLLHQPGNHIGAWHDAGTGKVFLDVSMVTHDEKQAHTLALKHDQIAYFDLKKGASVTVNRSATSGGTARPKD
jgi:hypothetical protein